MTTFAELQALVEEQTRRPEIPAVTKAAIRTATLRAHHTDFFPKDVAVGTLTYTPDIATFRDFTNISSSFSRLRTLKTVEGLDSVTMAPAEAFEYRELDDVYDADGTRRPSIYNVIGDTLRIYPQLQTGMLQIFYYQNPNTVDANYSSWIANTYPDELAAWAAAIVFARTGFAEMANEFQRNHIQPFKEMLVASHLLGNVN
jgi:hypothetical protein